MSDLDFIAELPGRKILLRGNHSRVVAHCAEKIAQECRDLDSDKAYLKTA